jgi:hypothetical protein
LFDERFSVEKSEKPPTGDETRRRYRELANGGILKVLWEKFLIGTKWK